ncbi:MAG: RpiB/LacA/LacB family sugar-phosphate isomerase [Oscillospiraceae bacterium]|nr:RpiB/LacA/LacB family sugar-phosphate isomerase [Oscillospiraceae bacterium]
MRIAVIQASSQAEKNELLFDTVKKYAADSEVINFGCRPDEEVQYSYIDVSIMVGLLLASDAVDFVVTGCSSGQGMMLACNSMPGVICGYAPTPMDAYLFCQINNGNAISVPLGEEYTWAGGENLEATIAKLFSEPFGQGYPRNEADRKLLDTERLKAIRKMSQTDFVCLMEKLDTAAIQKIMTKRDVVSFILEHGRTEVTDWLAKQNY